MSRELPRAQLSPLIPQPSRHQVCCDLIHRLSEENRLWDMHERVSWRGRTWLDSTAPAGARLPGKHPPHSEPAPSTTHPTAREKSQVLT